jgi:hypothetical protein
MTVHDNLHCAEREDDTNGHLLLTVHLQAPDNEDRNNTERPVRYATQRRVSVERVDDDFGVHAVPYAAAKLLPEMRY